MSIVDDAAKMLEDAGEGDLCEYCASPLYPHTDEKTDRMYLVCKNIECKNYLHNISCVS